MMSFGNARKQGYDRNQLPEVIMQFHKQFIAIIVTLCLVPIAAVAQSIDDEQENYIRANTIFFIYHELGHALIDLMRLPVFGQEEDAADVLGVVLSETINDEADNEIIMLATADNFAYMAETAAQEGYELAFWDTHGLDQQRYYTILCLHYGADPDRRQAIANDQELPEDRQQSCPEEYQLADESWGPVLDEMAANSGDWLFLHVADEPKGAAQKILFDAVQIEIDILNQAFSPEFELDLVFGRCGEANAYYDPNVQEITICAELAQLFTE
jgi:hypothetical protein